MKTHFLVLLFALIPFLVIAQSKESKYLEGAIPEINGKIIFSKSISTMVPISSGKLFTLMQEWAKTHYYTTTDLNNRILISNPDTKTIACAGEEYLVFKKTSFSLDRAKMSYQLILQIDDNKSNVTIKNLKYDYESSEKLILAEDFISDKYALSKDKDKLNRYYDKFRIQTIDSINSIYNSIDIYLNGINILGVTNTKSTNDSFIDNNQTDNPITIIPENRQIISESTESLKNTTTESIYKNDQRKMLTEKTISTNLILSANALSGYRSINAEEIPQNMIELLNNTMLITDGTSEQLTVTFSTWGGIGKLWNIPISISFMESANSFFETKKNGDTYTLSFFNNTYKNDILNYISANSKNGDKLNKSRLTLTKTPTGTFSFDEACLIIECSMIVSQKLVGESTFTNKTSNNQEKSIPTNMYIGEIKNIWIK